MNLEEAYDNNLELLEEQLDFGEISDEMYEEELYQLEANYLEDIHYYDWC